MRASRTLEIAVVLPSMERTASQHSGSGSWASFAGRDYTHRQTVKRKATSWGRRYAAVLAPDMAEEAQSRASVDREGSTGSNRDEAPVAVGDAGPRGRVVAAIQHGLPRQAVRHVRVVADRGQGRSSCSAVESPRLVPSHEGEATRLSVAASV